MINIMFLTSVVRKTFCVFIYFINFLLLMSSIPYLPPLTATVGEQHQTLHQFLCQVIMGTQFLVSPVHVRLLQGVEKHTERFCGTHSNGESELAEEDPAMYFIKGLNNE